jgi:hypothetical protein
MYLPVGVGTNNTILDFHLTPPPKHLVIKMSPLEWRHIGNIAPRHGPLHFGLDAHAKKKCRDLSGHFFGFPFYEIQICPAPPWQSTTSLNSQKTAS